MYQWSGRADKQKWRAGEFPNLSGVARRGELLFPVNPAGTFATQLSRDAVRFFSSAPERAVSPTVSLWILAVIFTSLNALKPLHIDDTAYYYVARNISQHPLDPYSFSSFWYDYPLPANQVLALTHDVLPRNPNFSTAAKSRSSQTRA